MAVNERGAATRDFYIFMRQERVGRVVEHCALLSLRGEPCKNEMLLSQMGVHFKR